MDQRKALRFVSKSAFNRLWKENTWIEDIDIDGYRRGRWTFTARWALCPPVTTPAKIRDWFDETAQKASTSPGMLGNLLRSLNRHVDIQPMTNEQSGSRFCVLAHLETGPHVLFHLPEEVLPDGRRVRGVHVDLMCLFAVMGMSEFANVTFAAAKEGVILAKWSGEVFGVVAGRLLPHQCKMMELLGI